MTKKILGVLSILLLLTIVGGAVLYAHYSPRYQKNKRIKEEITTTIASFEKYDKNNTIINQILAKNYNFTIIRKEKPSIMLFGLKCYNNNLPNASSSKIGDTLCDTNLLDGAGGSYLSIMWRNTSKDINLFQNQVLKDLLALKNSTKTLKNPLLYSEKSFMCKKDTTFKDTITGMGGRFVDCSLITKNNDLPLYVSFFYFSADPKIQDRNVIVFSNIGAKTKIEDPYFIQATRNTLQLIKKTYVTSSPVSIFKLNILDLIFEHAYAQESGGSDNSSSDTSSIGSFFSAIGSFFSGLANSIASAFSGSSLQSSVTLGAFAAELNYNGTILSGTQSDVAGMTEVTSGVYCCTATGEAVSVTGVSGGGNSGPYMSNGLWYDIPSVCGTTYMSCLTGAPGEMDPPDPNQWVCTTFKGQFLSVCTLPPPVNGQAGTDPNTCIAGTLSSPSTSGNTYTWTCAGANGGSDGAGVAYMTGTLNVSSPSCTIVIGQNSCPVTFSWNTVYPIGTSQVIGDGGGPYSTQANSYSEPLSVKYSGNTFRLKNNGFELANQYVSSSCITGGYDTINDMCADPQVPSASIIGQYYPPGTLSFTCSGSDSYSVDLNGSPFIPVTAYTGPVVRNNITVGGSYVIKCRHGSVSAQVARAYASVPPAAVVSLSVSPATLSKQDDVTVNWSTVFPTNACTLTAKVVCANNSCTAAQITAQNDLNKILTTTKTDINDPSGSRLVTTAITTVAPGHKDNSTPIITVDWKALGKKTLRILYTTDLTYWCSPTSKETKRIQVTKSTEQ
jgi:uncharacterized membrane protein